MDREEKSERAAVRVNASFGINLRPLGEGEEGLALEIENHPTSDRYHAPPASFADLPADLNDLAEFQEMQPHIYRMWMTLERKLDYLIRLQNPAVFDDPSMTEYFCIDLSAGGARVRFDDAPTPGKRYLFRLTPPVFPALLVEAVGTVIGVEEDEAGSKIVSFEFTALNIEDREALITYLFKRQREILRQKQDEGVY